MYSLSSSVKDYARNAEVKILRRLKLAKFENVLKIRYHSETENATVWHIAKKRLWYIARKTQKKKAE